MTPRFFHSLWRARAHQLAQDQAQVEGSHVDQLPLQNVIVAAQVGAPHATRVVTVRKANEQSF